MVLNFNWMLWCASIVIPSCLQRMVTQDRFSCISTWSHVFYFCVFRMVEAVTPTLAKLHPSAIVDELHFRCSSDVIAQNKLKKQASQTECPERKEGGRDNAGHKSDTSPGSGSTESDTKTSRLQVMVSLSRVSFRSQMSWMVSESEKMLPKWGYHALLSLRKMVSRSKCTTHLSASIFE